MTKKVSDLSAFGTTLISIWLFFLLILGVTGWFISLIGITGIIFVVISQGYYFLNKWIRPKFYQ